ncbi:hypothetical protein diail_8481 [Diaporthe ilicicola]|nr:hypothetical protein diail_8481 [Diaporthe ilicicola]
MSHLPKSLTSYAQGYMSTFQFTHLAIAIRDYQYLQDKKSVDKREAQNRKFRLHKYFYSAADIGIDPWESHYSYFQDEQTRSVAVDPLRRRLIEHLPARFTFSRQEREKRTREYEQGEPLSERSGFADALARFIIAIAGGACLIVPMVIMSLSPSEVKSLVTVSVAVVIFSLMLIIWNQGVQRRNAGFYCNICGCVGSVCGDEFFWGREQRMMSLRRAQEKLWSGDDDVTQLEGTASVQG